MTKFFIRWVINAVALYVAVLIVPGIVFRGEWVDLLWLALIFGLLNALVRPLLKLLTLPLIILTLGLFTLLINAGMLLLTSSVAQSFGLDFSVDGFWAAFLGGLVITLVSVVMSMIIRDDRKGRKRD
jgi:putative membrane protein